MFITPLTGRATELQATASVFGCKVGECVHGSGYGRPAIVGNTFGIKDQLKAAGARWDGACKAWAFESYAALESALNSIAQ